MFTEDLFLYVEVCRYGSGVVGHFVCGSVSCVYGGLCLVNRGQIRIYGGLTLVL